MDNDLRNTVEKQRETWLPKLRKLFYDNEAGLTSWDAAEHYEVKRSDIHPRILDLVKEKSVVKTCEKRRSKETNILVHVYKHVAHIKKETAQEATCTESRKD